MRVLSEIPIHGSLQRLLGSKISDLGQKERQQQDEEETRPMSAWEKGYV